MPGSEIQTHKSLPEASSSDLDIRDYRAGMYLRQYQYEAFVPSKVNHGWTWSDARLNTLLEEATQALGELNGCSFIVPDVDLFISLHVVKEASESSRIEGTQTNMDEALRPVEEIDPERRDDWQEVQNYIQAMNEAIEALRELPLSNRLLRETHRTLLQGVRGEHKMPGEWRRSQNWIGGTSLQDTVFIPPPHHEVPELMGDLEKFWHNEEINVPHLVRIAISHYQFETIHPFLDGNGRIGRLLITLYLISNGLLAKPALYLSSYFERHRAAYYDAFTVVRGTSDLGHWVRFFLLAIRETARNGVETFQAILKLRADVERRVLTLGQRAGNARRVLSLLYQRPFVNVNEVADYLEVTHQTANRLVEDLVRLDILREATGFRRNRRFVFRDYLTLFLPD
ncbi:MAG TPA: Fic family protein [Rhodothermales bacterium]|nr:Fic family protein [Rhodothermales bacterium]